MILRPTILSGGAGTRLWPLSRQLQPKQFWALTNEFSMFQNTLERVNGLPELGEPLIISNYNHRFQVQNQLNVLELNSAPILLEPLAKNTAPALTVAALHLLSQSDQMMLVMAADHVIKDINAFQAATIKAIELAKGGQIVTFGIVPTYPETGYGYIQQGPDFKVERFVEKPNLELAQEYLSDGNFLWNSGMFVVTPQVWLNEVEAHSPEMMKFCKASLENAEIKQNHYFLSRKDFENCPSDSIDYAVMEKTAKASVVALDAGWSDVGSWLSLWEINEHDEDGNAVDGDVVLVDTQNSFVKSNHRLTAVVGLKDVVIMDTRDALLVLNKNQSQSVKKVVEKLRNDNHPTYSSYAQQLHEWGQSEKIRGDDNYIYSEISLLTGALMKPSIEKTNQYIVLKGVVSHGERLYKAGEHFLIEKNNSDLLVNNSAQEIKIMEIKFL